MSDSEFSIIEEFFTNKQKIRQDVIVGISDDAAVTSLPPGMQLVTAIDTLVNGTHFTSSTTAFDIAYKSVMVNLSDLAAMGAEPAWATLALTLPQADRQWLSSFSEGLFSALNEFNVQLLGGDTTRGPLTISVQVNGFVPQGSALLRSGATAGDKIYVTGNLGDAGLGLLLTQGGISLDEGLAERVLEKLNRPMARVKQGLALRGIANAVIDISDGLIGDLKHILDASHTGAMLYLDQIPVSQAYQSIRQHEDDLDLALTAGEDYELCICAPGSEEARLKSIFADGPCELTCIGEITQGDSLQCVSAGGDVVVCPAGGFDHFTSRP